MTLAAEHIPQATIDTAPFNGFLPVRHSQETESVQPYLQAAAAPSFGHQSMMWPKVDLGPAITDIPKDKQPAAAWQQQTSPAEQQYYEHPTITAFNRVLAKAGLNPNATNADLISDKDAEALRQIDASDEMALYGLLHVVNRAGLNARPIRPSTYAVGIERSEADVAWFEARAHRLASEKEQLAAKRVHDLQDNPRFEQKRPIGVAPVRPQTRPSTVAAPLPETVTTFTSLGDKDTDPERTNSWDSWQHTMDETDGPGKPTGGNRNKVASVEADDLDNLSGEAQEKLLKETNRSIWRMRLGLAGGSIATGAIVAMTFWGETITKWGEAASESISRYF